MSVFLSPSSERNFCFLLDKSNSNDSTKDGSAESCKKEDKVKIWVSKEFLAVVSPVFKAMFYGDLRESKAKCVYLVGKNDEDFLKFLDCLFPYPTRKELNDTNIDAVLSLSDKYQVASMLKKCDRYYDKWIRASPIGKKEILMHLPIFVTYKLNRAINALVPYAAALHLDDLMRYRSQNKQSSVGYVQFFSAVFEAKLRRTLHEAHEWAPDPTASIVYQCKKCDLREMQGITNTKCEKFHTCTSKGNDCICGYDFEQINLM